MSAFMSQGAGMLKGWRKPGRFDVGVGAQLPEAYRKFWREWKVMKPAAVHYIPETGRYKRDELTGEVKPVQDIPIPLLYPKEHNDGIWGGEGVIKGFQKRDPFRRRVPHFWVPVLRRSVVYSEVLNQYISVTVTDRTMRLIHDNYGFDHYLLKTPACDLKSTLALTLKRQILQALQNGCPAYKDDQTAQDDVYNQYKQYLSAYTNEEIEWYGLTFVQACQKFIRNQQNLNKPKPLKCAYRSELIDKLREVGISGRTAASSSNTTGGETGKKEEEKVPVEGLPNSETPSSSWLEKINPFGKRDL